MSKNKRSGLLASQGSRPLLQFSRFFVEFWEREAAPADLMPVIIAAISGRLASELAAKNYRR